MRNTVDEMLHAGDIGNFFYKYICDIYRVSGNSGLDTGFGH